MPCATSRPRANTSAGSRPTAACAVDGTLVEDALERDWLFAQARQLHQSGLSLRKIAAELDARGFTTSRQGKAFWPAQISRMVAVMAAPVDLPRVRQALAASLDRPGRRASASVPAPGRAVERAPG
ncbi:MAG: hypothetical protein MZV65_42985 [Chromatiales bacterium]|nr:hypothetical protein [Chromatiales bacterium]